MKEQPRILKKHILTGASHMIPFIVAGGILFSLTVMLNPAGAATPETGWLAGLAQIGLGGLALFASVLGGYIAYSIADKPDLAPDMIGTYLAKEMGAGFFGDMMAGLIAGVVVKELKRIKLPISLKTLGSIFIYPLVSTLVIGDIIVQGIGGSTAAIINGFTNWLSSLGDVGRMPLASIPGAMTAFDAGGSVDEVTTLFAQTQVDTLPYLMGGTGVTVCASPIDMGTATLLVPKKYSMEEKGAEEVAILTECMRTTEGAIPFTANDPLKVISSLIMRAVVDSIIPFLAGVLSHAPRGRLIMLPVVEDRIQYFIAVLAGGFMTAPIVNLFKKNYMKEFAGSDTGLNDLDEITFDEL